jgi:23S rRNA (guanosine2251-2'-O)-methyltransferase
MRKIKNSELNRLNIEDFRNSEKNPVCVVLDNVRSMNNIGSVFRTCDAFRIEKLFLCGITATPPHREIQKTALDATESVEWEYFEKAEEAIKILRKNKFVIYAVEQTDKSQLLNKMDVNHDEKIALVFGNEINGIGDETLDACDFGIEIPQFGTKHSLNISVSAGIVLWHILSKIKQC